MKRQTTFLTDIFICANKTKKVFNAKYHIANALNHSRRDVFNCLSKFSVVNFNIITLRHSIKHVCYCLSNVIHCFQSQVSLCLNVTAMKMTLQKHHVVKQFIKHTSRKEHSSCTEQALNSSAAQWCRVSWQKKLQYKNYCFAPTEG